jgi:hypothetical protein
MRSASWMASARPLAVWESAAEALLILPPLSFPAARGQTQEAAMNDDSVDPCTTRT